MKVSQSFAKRRARIEIIPLIDIIFFLLATFVMVSLSMVKNQGLSIHLPKAVTGSALERSSSVALTVKENGDLYFNKEKIEADELFQRLQQLKASQPEARVVVHGDELASFGDIVNALDRVRESGIQKVAIQTQNALRAAAPRDKSFTVPKEV